jgi:hypothetical protein
MKKMSMKTRILFSIIVMLAIALACGGGGLIPSKPIQPLPTPTEFTPTESPSPTSSPSNTPSVTPTHTLTNTPTKTSTLTPTITPTKTSTNTPLPPLPDFEQVLTFAQGGGGEFCGRYPENGAKLAVIDIDPGKALLLCFASGSISPPFQLEWFAPDGRVFTSRVGKYGGTQREYFMRWPINLPSGQWRIHASGSGFSADADFFVPKENENLEYVYITDPGSVNQIQETGILQTYGVHDLKLVDNTAVNVIGKNYPANSPIYILVYRALGHEWKFSLIHKLITLSDNHGLIAFKLSGLFEIGQSYLVIGLSDPNSVLTDNENNFNFGIPHDHIYVVPSTACPGAPLQRIVVNQRGYVCTQGDSVNLRDGPSKSSNKVVPLPVGSQFTVIAGPACSDNWSWWQIQTDDGDTGWISEGGDEVDPYFICPLP